MILLSNSAAQTIVPGGTITFDDVLLHTGSGECHRANTGTVKLRANGVYKVVFSGNISSPTAGTPAQLAIKIGGETLKETNMMVTTSAANALNNVSTTTALKNCCGDYDRLTVANIGSTAITLAPNSALFIKRLS